MNEGVIGSKLYTMLDEAFAPSRLEVIDESHHHAGHREAGDQPQETHFRVIIRSDAFKGMAMVAQHRAIYKEVDILMPTPIHALAIHSSV